MRRLAGRIGIAVCGVLLLVAGIAAALRRRPSRTIPGRRCRGSSPASSHLRFRRATSPSRTTGRGRAATPARPSVPAIAACHRAGGGRVVVPPGEFASGPIHLLSNVNLHVSTGATIRFSTRPRALTCPSVLTRWEGVELMNYSPLVYAYEQENIAVTGEGTLDGQAGARALVAVETRRRPQPARSRTATASSARPRRACRWPSASTAPGHYLRPQFIQPYRCRNVLIEGVTIRNAPMWVIHPVLSTNVTVRGVHGRLARAQQRRLQPGVLGRRADRGRACSTPATTASPSSRAATRTGGGWPRPPSASWSAAAACGPDTAASPSAAR